MGRSRKALLAAAAMLLGIAAAAVPALADDISNSLDATVDSTVEIMSLNVGGPTKSTTLYVVPQNGDGKQGCNLTGSTTLGVNVFNNNPSVATVSPSSLTFGSCGDTKTLTVTPVGAGTANISLTLVTNTTGGSFALGPAAFDVAVAPAATNTAPTVSVTGVTAGQSYEYGAVPAATCVVTDAEDGGSTFAATLSAVTGPLAVYGLGSQTASCSYTDAGGLTASSSATYAIVDTTDPTITFVSRTAPNAYGWNNGPVTVTWSCTDATAVVAPSVSTTVSSEGLNQSAVGTCTDVSGNTASDTQTGINIDLTNPSVSLVGGPADGASYYFGFVPAAPTCSASDALSGLAAPCSVSGYSAAVGNQAVTASATDKAGNSGSASASYSVLAWTLKGFYQPVDMGNVMNTVKNGSTVPLKFEVFAGPTELTSTSVVSTLTKQVACVGSVEDSIEVVATGGTSLRYDTTGGQFVFNWQTPKAPGSCYAVTVTTADGSSISATFRLK